MTVVIPARTAERRSRGSGRHAGRHARATTGSSRRRAAGCRTRTPPRRRPPRRPTLRAAGRTAPRGRRASWSWTTTPTCGSTWRACSPRTGRWRRPSTARSPSPSIRARRPDVVLTDVMMPNLDGFGLVARLRADEATADLPVIVLSARAGEESRIEGLQAGADDYLVKPFSARELIARVQVHVTLAQLRRKLLERAVEATARGRGRHARQGRVPGHAGPRAAKPPVAHRDGRRADAAARRELEGAVGHRAPAQAARAAGRRPARRLEDHAREGRPPQGAHVDRRGRQARRRDHAAAASSRGSSRSRWTSPAISSSMATPRGCSRCSRTC